jgi:hypothetical protein
MTELLFHSHFAAKTDKTLHLGIENMGRSKESGRKDCTLLSRLCSLCIVHN